MELTIISVNDVVYDFGVRSLSSYLKQGGHKVNLIFIPVAIEKLSDRILEEVWQVASKSPLVGISVLTHSYQKAVAVTEFLKKRQPATVVMWGGIHASSFPNECLEHADLVCVGEGEETFLELAERIESGTQTEDVPNSVLKGKNGAIKVNPVRPLIQDLDSLPFPDYSLENDHVAHEGKLHRLGWDTIREFLLYYPYKDMGYVYITLTSRGCPFDCTFCCNNVLRSIYRHEKKYVRKRSVGHVLSELESIIKIRDCFDFILLEDDSFLIRDLDEIHSFSEQYRSRIGLPFGVEMNPNEVSEAKVAKLRDAGLSMVHIGIQSGDEQVRRKYYHRYTSDEKIIEVNRALTRLGILHKYDIIIDTPFEGDSEASLKLLRKLNPYFSINLYSLRVYPGLALEALIREFGFKEWLQEHNRGKSYYDILSDDPYAMVLRLYKPFPPTKLSFAVARIFSSDISIALLKISFLRHTISVFLVALRVLNKIFNGQYLNSLLRK